MLRNYRLRFVLLVMLLALGITTPVRGEPGEFGKITPPNGVEHQSLTPTLSWEDSEGAASYAYCYDTTNDNLCGGTWISSGTVTLPPSGLEYNTTYYWQVRAIDAEGEMTYANEGVWWSFTTQHPALAVDKALTAQSATPIALGTVLTYTITATNSGDVTLANVVVNDTLLTPTGGTSPCATLAMGANCTLVGVYTVTQADVDAGVIVNTGSALSDEITVAVTDTVMTSILQHPALAVDKALTAQSATPIALGTVLTYTVTATNTGDVTLSNVVVDDTLVTPSSVGCSPVAPGGICILTGSYEVQEPDFMAGTIVNTATATANDPNGGPLTPVTDTITTPLVAAAPLANPDVSLGSPIGQAVTVDVLVNDMRGDLPLDPTSVVIVNPPPGSTLVLDKLLVVPGQGYWVVDATTGAITFTPETDFAGDPTPITYTVDDVQGNTSNVATVTVTYTPPPEANDDASLGNPVGNAVTVDVLDNDEVAAGRTLEPASVHIVGADTGSGGKTLTVSGEGVWMVDSDTGEITFTPEAGFEDNPMPISYTVEDDQGNTSNTATVTVTYTENPLARNDALLGNPVGSAVTVAVLDNDVAAPGRTLDPASVQITGTANPGDSLVVARQGIWSVNAITGAITFTPEEDFEGNPTPIAYTMTDDQGNVSNVATVTVTYTEPPVANNDASLSNPVDSVVTVDVLANDTAAAGRTLDPASVQITGTVNPGESLVVAGQGTWSVYTITGAITFTLEAGFGGNPTPIAYTVDDDQGNVSNAATLTVTYTAPPVANDDASLDNPVGSAVTVDVLLNDTAALSRTLNPASVQITGTANPGESLVVAGQGIWSVNTSTGAITFTPEAGFEGNPTAITYTVADDQGNVSNAATVTVTYTEPPVANDDTLLGNAVGSAVTVDVLLNDTAAVSRTLDPATVQISGTANPGDSLVVVGEGTWSVNITTGAITFTPEAGFEGNPAAITYTVADDQGNTSDLATVTITYTENPLARDDVSAGNAIGSVVTLDVLVNDVAAPDRTLDLTSVVIVGAPGDGKELVVPGEGTWTVNAATGAITFTPEEGFTGNPTLITYTVHDDQGNVSNAATVAVTYTEPPVAVNDSSTGNPVGSAVTVDVLVNDTAAMGRALDPVSMQITGTANPGDSLVVMGQGMWSVVTTTGVIIFTPEGDFAGNPTPIAYTVADDQGNISNPAMVTVTYTEPPVADDDESTGNAIGSVVTVDVLANDVAAAGRILDPASVQIMGTANPGESLAVVGQGTWSVINITGAITFTPEEGFTGNPTPIMYTMADDQGNVSNAATVTVTYTEPPVANDDASTDNAVGSAVTVDVLVNDTVAADRTLNPASVQITGTANPGESLVVAGQGTWAVNIITGAITFTPEAGFETHPAPIAYTVDDDQGNASNPAIVMITYADKEIFVYLPLTVRHWPPIPVTPVLNAISNPEGDGNYIVSWNSTEYATSYVLQESNTSSFSDAVQVYSDTATTVSLNDRGPTRYYYRVQARNIYANSAWSNVRSVDVLWEKEPNDDALTQANGPLISGLTYYGHFLSGEDKKDYFFIYLPSTQSVELWLSNIVAGQDYDLTLRNAALQVVAHSGELGNADEHIRTATLPAGWYYIQVYNRSGNGSTQAYHLRVVYPTVVLTALDKNVPMSMPRSANPPPEP